MFLLRQKFLDFVSLTKVEERAQVSVTDCKTHNDKLTVTYLSRRE